MLRRTESKSSLLLVLFFSILKHELCAYPVPSENCSISMDSEIHVGLGVILNMESWVGKAIHSCINMAISDFYGVNKSYRTRIVLHTRDDSGDPLQALSAVLDLLNSTKVQAIIGPETYLDARLLASVADKAKVPIFSFASQSSMEYPYLFQIKEDESTTAKSIATLVESFKWRNVIFVYEDTDSGREILPYLFEMFEAKNIKISYRSAISASAMDDQITEELHKIMTVHATIMVVHMSPLLASSLFVNAKRLGMVSKEYAWIMTDKTTDLLQSISLEVKESLQGVLGLRSYIPASSKLQNLTDRLYKECNGKYPNFLSGELSVFGIRAYDTIWALAESVERLGVQIPIHWKNGSEVPKNGPMLLNEIMKIRFKGISGEFQFIEGKLVSRGFEIVNVIGYSARRVGYWTLSEGITKAYAPVINVHLLSNTGLEAVIWPGGSITTPKGWILRMTYGKKLRIGVLLRVKFKYFLDADYDVQTNVTTVSGLSVDVFNTVVRALPYEVPYEFIPFTNERYEDLIGKVYTQEIDAIVGDSTILANRSEYIDFTATYTDLGVGTLARVNNNDMWIILKPLDVDLWLTSAAFLILTGFVVWAIEFMDKESQGSPTPKIAEIFWFILLTLFFAQRDKLSSNLSKFVLFMWLLVVFILMSSYTATLASLLTVEQFELASKGGIVGFHGGSFVGGVTVNNLNFEDYRRRPYYSYEDYADALSRGGKNGGADAIIDEIPYIKMFLGRYSADYAMISSESITSGFAFIFQKGSPLVAELSREIAKIREDGTLKLLENKWHENGFAISSEGSVTQPKTLNFGSFRGIFLISGVSSALALLLSVIFLLWQKLEVHNIITFITGRNLMATISQTQPNPMLPLYSEMAYHSSLLLVFGLLVDYMGGHIHYRSTKMQLLIRVVWESLLIWGHLLVSRRFIAPSPLQLLMLRL